MTGTGTSADPYIVGTWAELKTAMETAGAYVELGGDIDLNSEYPEGVPNIAFQCTSLDGKGHTLKNIYSTGSVFSQSRNKAAAVSNLNIADFYIQGGKLFSLSQSTTGGSFTASNLTISGEIYNGSFAHNYHIYPNFDSCSINLYLSGTSYLQSDDYRLRFSRSRVHLSGNISSSKLVNAQLLLINSELTGKVESSAATCVLSLENSSTSSVIDAELPGFTKVFYTGTNPVLINADKTGSAELSANLIQATQEQMTDAQWLHDQGFPVGVN